MNIEQIKQGDRLSYYPAKVEATDNEHPTVTVDALLKRRVRVILPDGSKRAVSARSLAPQVDMFEA